MDEKPREKTGMLQNVSVPMNGWTVTVVLLVLMVGFVIWGTPEKHDMFLAGVERIVAALKDLLT